MCALRTSLRLVLCVALVAVAACQADDEPVASTATVPGAEVPVEEVVAAHGDAVWRVETAGCGWTGIGTAFAIDPQRLVTNHHVVATDITPTIRSRSGDTREGRVVGSDPERDIAVIEVDDPVPVTVSWAPTTSLQPDERLVVIGYPRPDFDFTVSFGTIVGFAGPERPTDLVVSNAPIDRGNSGGPALRGDGTVVGVVTRVVLDDPGEALAIVHTADRVTPAVEASIAQPQEVAPDCGLGPDYEPPVPEGVDITEPPPPPTPEVTATSRRGGVEPSSTDPPTSSPGSAATQPTAPPPPTPLPCPEGAVEAEVTQRSATTAEEGTRVEARGIVTNRSARTVVVESVRVTFAGPEPVVVEAVVETPLLEPSGATSWEVSAIVDGPPEDRPAPAVAAEWRWWSDSLAHCPGGGAA